MNIYEFFQAAVDSLQKYILIHYDRDTWFERWVALSDVRKYYETVGGTLGNSYFYFDWTVAAYHLMARRAQLYRCTLCGAIGEKGDHDEGCTDLVQLCEGEAYEYLSDCQYICDDILMETLLGEGWETFCAGTHKFTDAIKDEVLDCLTAIARDEGEQQFADLAWALNIHHRNGNIARQYSQISYALIDDVQQNGLRAAFDEEEIADFLAGGYPQIEMDLDKLNSLCKEAE